MQHAIWIMIFTLRKYKIIYCFVLYLQLTCCAQVYSMLWSSLNKNKHETKCNRKSNSFRWKRKDIKIGCNAPHRTNSIHDFSSLSFLLSYLPEQFLSLFNDLHALSLCLLDMSWHEDYMYRILYCILFVCLLAFLFTFHTILSY
jgi:hypothetical protein